MENEQTPSYLVEMAKVYLSETQKKYESARTQVPEKYHGYLALIPKERILTTQHVPLDENARAHQMGHNEKGTFVLIQEPYLGVDGRVIWAREEHREMKKRLDIVSEAKGNTIVCTISSEMYGTTTGHSMWAANKNWSGSGSDIQNVETNAVGRALGFMGYGLLGTGIASAEEILLARSYDEEMKKSRSSQKQQESTRSKGIDHAPLESKERVHRPDQAVEDKPSSVSDTAGDTGKSGNSGLRDRQTRNDVQRQQRTQEAEEGYFCCRILNLTAETFDRIGVPYYRIHLKQVDNGNEFEALAVDEILEFIDSDDFEIRKPYNMTFEQRPSKEWIITRMVNVVQNHG
ncbi:hypothetical protein M2444_004642 [Paenibacillus sp. PastF-3]|uniref:hypothetical protein n=1 Tax=Paenibacillus sp. PastF-3 TaxID=2940626 RepID=UPI0024734086|nr:hypothetical protein [Paenibacillus sp. PastF-3]MDH6372813.1 hypothetical protein [Paenibacillus sp. PastF-3]